MQNAQVFRKLFTLLFISVFYWFSACSGGGGNSSEGAPKIDAEIVHGQKEKAFYKTLSPQDAKIILTEGKGATARFFRFTSGKLSSPETISGERLTFSTSGKVITLLGEDGFFEYSPTKLDSVNAGQTPPPPALIDALCTEVTESGYSELLVATTSVGLEFSAVKGNQIDVLGGTGAIVKTESSERIVYQKAGFGELVINKSIPRATDALSFKSSLSTVPVSNWNQVQGMYCRLNSVPVQIPVVNKSKYQDFVMADYPLGYWKLGETTGSVALDISGFGNHGTHVNGPVLGVTGAITSESDFGLSLPGSTEYVEMGTAGGAFNFGSQDFSIEMWIYRRADCGSFADSNWGLNMWNRGTGSVGGNSWGTDFCGPSGLANKIRFAIESGTTTFSANALDPMALNTWYHIVGVREGTSIKLYVNGVLQSTIPVGTAAVNSVGNTMRLGTNMDNGGELDGKADEVAVYNHALSLAQVSAHYQAGVSGTRPSPQVSTVTHNIFVTQNTFTGGFVGGVSGADLQCDLAAKALGTKTASLPGVWKAVVSTTTAIARDRLTFHSGASVVDSNGDLISELANDIWAGSLIRPINHDEFGMIKLSTGVWTGSTASGGKLQNCNNWTGNTSPSGVLGLSSATDGRWLSNILAGTGLCDDPYPLYCINSKD